MSLLGTIQRIVRDELAATRTAELAVVQEQHPHASDGDTDNYACTVRLRGSDLVLRQVPVATGRIGVASIPAVGELVLVQFLGGDVNSPVITARLYNDEDRPPVNEDGQAIVHLPLGAEDADAVRLELHSGDRRELAVKIGAALALTIRDDDPVLDLDVDGGKATLSLARDGAVSLTSQGALEVKASEITITADGKLTLKGATVNIN